VGSADVEVAGLIILAQENSQYQEVVLEQKSFERRAMIK